MTCVTLIQNVHSSNNTSTLITGTVWLLVMHHAVSCSSYSVGILFVTFCPDVWQWPTVVTAVPTGYVSVTVFWPTVWQHIIVQFTKFHVPPVDCHSSLVNDYHSLLLFVKSVLLPRLIKIFIRKELLRSYFCCAWHFIWGCEGGRNQIVPPESREEGRVNHDERESCFVMSEQQQQHATTDIINHQTSSSSVGICLLFFPKWVRLHLLIIVIIIVWFSNTPQICCVLSLLFVLIKVTFDDHLSHVNSDPRKLEVVIAVLCCNHWRQHVFLEP